MLFLALSVPVAVAVEQVTIAAAADLNYALKDLATRFEHNTGNKVTLSFGASGSFYSQIQSGAPYDLFFSADMDYPRKLAAAGLVENASLRVYGVGHLVLWVPKSSTLDPGKLKMDLLLQPSVRQIAIANPQHAPYGRAAMAALDHFGLKDKVANKLVLGRKHQPGGPVRAIGQCAGGSDRPLAGYVSRHERRW